MRGTSSSCTALDAASSGASRYVPLLVTVWTDDDGIQPDSQRWYPLSSWIPLPMTSNGSRYWFVPLGSGSAAQTSLKEIGPVEFEQTRPPAWSTPKLWPSSCATTLTVGTPFESTVLIQAWRAGPSGLFWIWPISPWPVNEHVTKGNWKTTITLSQVSALYPVAALNCASAWVPQLTSLQPPDGRFVTVYGPKTSPSLRSLPVSETWPYVSSWMNWFTEFGAVKMMLRSASTLPGRLLSCDLHEQHEHLLRPGREVGGAERRILRLHGRRSEAREDGHAADDRPASQHRVVDRDAGARGSRQAVRQTQGHRALRRLEQRDQLRVHRRAPVLVGDDDAPHEGPGGGRAIGMHHERAEPERGHT